MTEWSFTRNNGYMSSTVFIAMGSNLGDRRAHLIEGWLSLEAALSIQAESAKVSSLYETSPIDMSDDLPGNFYNVVVCCETEHSAEKVLALILTCEKVMGRERTQKNASRSIDLDLLCFNDLELKLPSLILPHPRIAERGFVLEPLFEIAPQLLIPGQGTVASLRKQWLNRAQSSGEQVNRIEGPTWVNVEI
jgi:2-amino-4-hydroxy-6-hydroxymethyldihydropteridine diphosphokinase